MKNAIRNRWPEVRALFESALAMPGSERAAYLARQAPDGELRDAVLAMLAEEDDAPLATGPATVELRSEPDSTNAERIGRYRIVRTLGQGGMGVVYLAEQEQPRRLVALKLISGRHDAQSLGRFKREADALGRLSHPGIAQIIEVDTDAQQRPFLVMEYVAGRSLAAHAAGLDRNTRLELLARIAEAVHHAHERGVVHRDLKPSNVLVTAEGQPKVLDFGIASLQEVGAESLTETGMLLGTPAYMSPEQAGGRGPIDARADLYALGVIGYELLTDRLPLPVAGLTPLQALRVVEEETPPPLSRIDKRLRGDLEVIFGKALSKEPSLRYPSGGAFADDLRRYLANEPIKARRASAWRRLVLYGRRKPVQLALAAATTLSLVGGIVVSLWFAYGQAQESARATAEAQRATAEARRAEQARERAEGTVAALGRVFNAGNPTLAGHPDVSFREVLASAEQQVAGLSAEVRAPVLLAIGDAQASVGEVKPALGSYASAEKLALEANDARVRLRAAYRRAALMQQHGNPSEFRKLVVALLADPALDADPLVRTGLLVLSTQDDSYSFKWKSARRHFGEALAAWPARSDARDAVLRAEIDAAMLVQGPIVDQEYTADGSKERAQLERMRESIDRIQRELGSEHPALVRLTLATEMFRALQGVEPGWATRIVQDLRARQAELGPTHPAVLARLELARYGIQGVTDAAAQIAFIGIAADSARALPMDSRWRARTAALQSRMPWGRGHRKFSAGDYLAMEQALCPSGDPDDADCRMLRISAARMLAESGRTDEAIAQMEAVRAAYDGSDPAVVAGLATALWELYPASRADDAAAVTEEAIAAIKRNTELNEVERYASIFNASLGFRPYHCERALAHIEPIEEDLRVRVRVDPDILARIFAACEVRVGRDPARAIARLDAVWQTLATGRAETDLVRAELINGYLEIYEVLGRDAEFRQWAKELRRMVDGGMPVGAMTSGRFPWINRALSLEPSRKPALRPGS